MNKVQVAANQEPIMALAILIAAILAVVGISVDANTVLSALAVVLPLAAGLIGRSAVTPVKKP